MQTKAINRLPDEEEGRPLPNWAYVSLTEAATWAVEGDSRDDDYLIEQAKRLGRPLRQQWHCPSGEPSWLLPHLDLLRQGRTPECDDQESHDPSNVWRGTFADAKHWLAKTGREAEAAYNEVAAIVARHRAIEDAYTQFYELLRDQCSDGRIVLLGIERHKSSSSSAGVHRPIPMTFFLRPIFHWRGTGYHDKGELGPDSNGASFEAIMSKTDARPYYLEVRIKREDVLKLAGLFQGRHYQEASLKRRPGAPPIKREAAKAALLARYPDGVPPHGLSNAAVAAQIQEDLAANGGPTVSARTVDKARHDLESAQK